MSFFWREYDAGTSLGELHIDVCFAGADRSPDVLLLLDDQEGTLALSFQQTMVE